MTNKLKRKCEMVIESDEKSVNDTGYNEKPAQYMANPKKKFWETIKNLFKKEK